MTATALSLPYGTVKSSAWSVVPLKHLARLTNGFVFNSDTWAEDGTPIIRIENLNGSESFNFSRLELNEKYQIHPGALLFSWSGNPGTSFGPYRWTKPGVHYLNQHIFNLTATRCHVDWLFWALKSATHWIERELTSGMIGMVHVTKDDLGNVPIPIPPLDEQRRIAGFLDAETASIDSLMLLRREALKLLTQREQAVRDGLVNALLAEHGEIPLRRLITRIDQGASPQCDAFPRENREWGVLKLSAIKSGRFNAEENKRLPADVAPHKDYEIKPGDLLVTRANTPQLVGDVAVVRGDVRGLLLPDLIYRVALIPDISPEYVSQVVLSGRIRTLIESTARGSSQSMVKLRGEDIREWPIPAADSTQQQSLVREVEQCTSAATTAADKIRHQLGVLAERRHALITAAVTGQLDVTTTRRSLTE